MKFNLTKNVLVFFLLSFVFAFFLFLEIKNNRFWMNDFKVYYSATANFFDGKDFYNIPFGLPSGLYKYSPQALFFFLPFTFFDFDTAKVLFYVLSAISIIASFIIMNFLITQFGKKEYSLWKLLLVILITANHFLRELHLGNINSILLLLNLLVLLLILKNKRDYLAGIILSVIIIFKPHFLLLLFPLFLFFEFKVLISLIVSLILFFFLPLLKYLFSEYIVILKKWFEVMKIHNLELVVHPDAIYSWFSRIFETRSELIIIFVLIFVGIAFLIFHSLILKYESNHKMPTHFMFEYLMLISLIPNLTLTDTQHFLYSMPLLFIIFYLLDEVEFNKKYLLLLLIPGIFLYGFNWHDLLGHEFSLKLTKLGATGLGNLLLIILFCILYIVWKKPRKLGYLK